MEQQTQIGSRSYFGKIFEYCLVALIFLLPVAFYPSSLVALYSLKMAVLVSIIVVFVGMFLAYVLSGGMIQLPKSKVLLALAAFPVVAIVSSLFSGAAVKSLAGEFFELGTSGSFLILALVVFLAVFAVKDESKTGIKAVSAFLLSSGLVILHLLLRIFAGSILPESVSARIPNFLVGGPTDTAILLGSAVIASLAALNMLHLGKKSYIGICTLVALSMLFIGGVGFMPVIVSVGLFALIYFVYTFSWSVNPSSGFAKGNKTLFPSLFVLIVSVVFILSSGTITGYLSQALKINSIEVRPNFEVTSKLVGEAMKSNAAIGVGPNMFKELWDMHKPADINATQFWAANFNFGSGLVPTVAATTGLLGLISLLAFLVLYVRSGFRAIFSSLGDSGWRYVSLTSFLVSLFFWLMAFFYVPSISVASLMFVFSGIAIASLVPQGVTSGSRINIFSNPKTNFASVFVIVVLLISSIAGGYFVIERTVAASVYQRGFSLLSVGDNQNAKLKLGSAIRIAENDAYWRAYSEASLTRAGAILNSISSPQNMTEEQRNAIQVEIADAVEGAKKAIAWNSKNYENWFALGRIYEVLGSNGIQGAYENAKGAYVEAQTRAPLNPAVPLAFGRIAAASNELDLARQNINKAIELKGNYTDAYFTLAQLEAAMNNIPAAIKSVEATTLLDPQNAGLYFQLGLLKYNYNDFSGAAGAFLRAVEFIPDYANAKYFLGLSLERMGKRADAIIQFEDLQKTNPDNNEVSFILSNLKAGKSPFTNVKPPMDSKPEKRSEPPVEE